MRRLVLSLVMVVFVMAAAVCGYRTYLVHELRKSVLAELNDPLSAQFRNERLFSTWLPSESILCGEVNAKNRMGGYVGFRKFQALPESVLMDLDMDDQFYKNSGLLECSFDAELRWWMLRW